MQILSHTGAVRQYGHLKLSLNAITQDKRIISVACGAEHTLAALETGEVCSALYHAYVPVFLHDVAILLWTLSPRAALESPNIPGAHCHNKNWA